MGLGTEIAWCDATFNSWRGCSAVSPGCKFCYAERMSKRNPAIFGKWGVHGKRIVAAESYWRQPYAWNRKAEKLGKKLLVFCASLADVMEDHPLLEEPRQRLWKVVAETPNLNWLILTKRPENFEKFLPPLYGPRLWLGVSVENQDYDYRINMLREIPATVRFVSAEPLLGPLRNLDLTGIHWLIVGGESGPRARYMDIQWALQIRAECYEQRVAFFFKQLSQRNSHYFRDMDFFPESLQVREFLRY